MRIIDLYAGAGGFSLGFSRVFDADHFAVESWAAAASTWRANFGDGMIEGRVVDVIDALPTEADIVIGGPPCQGFSLLNPANWNPDSVDPRRDEWVNFLSVVERCKPKVFVMENVTRMAGTDVLAKILHHGSEIGYCMNCAKLSAADFGASTTRTRLIVVGALSGMWEPPRATHGGVEGGLFGSDLPPHSTPRDAIGDLPEPKPLGQTEIPLHFYGDTKADRHRCSLVPIEVEDRLGWLREHHPDLIWPTYRNRGAGFFTTAYAKIDWDGIGPTITTKFLDPSAGRFTHPDGQRTITLREGARLQSFPDSFEFTGSIKSIAKQIGNAVPPVLSEAIAKSLKGVLQ